MGYDVWFTLRQYSFFKLDICLHYWAKLHTPNRSFTNFAVQIIKSLNLELFHNWDRTVIARFFFKWRGKHNVSAGPLWFLKFTRNYHHRICTPEKILELILSNRLTCYRWRGLKIREICTWSLTGAPQYDSQDKWSIVIPRPDSFTPHLPPANKGNIYRSKMQNCFLLNKACRQALSCWHLP